MQEEIKKVFTALSGVETALSEQVDNMQPIEVARILNATKEVVDISLKIAEAGLGKMESGHGQKLRDSITSLKQRYNENEQALNEICANSEVYNKLIAKGEKIEQTLKDMNEKINSAKDLEAKEQKAMQQLTAEYNELREKIVSWQNQYAEIENEHRKNLELYKNYFETNDTILRAVLSNSTPSEVSLSTISADIKQKLTTFDQILKDLIAKRDALPVELMLTNKN